MSDNENENVDDNDNDDEETATPRRQSLVAIVATIVFDSCSCSSS